MSKKEIFLKALSRALLFLLVAGGLLLSRYVKVRKEQGYEKLNTDDIVVAFDEAAETGSFDSTSGKVDPASAIKKLNPGEEAAFDAGSNEESKLGQESIDQDLTGEQSGKVAGEKALTEAQEEALCEYFRSILSQDEAENYDLIKEACKTRQIKTLKTLDVDLVARLYTYVIYDHPELYASEGYQMTKQLVNDKLTRIDFASKYNMTPEEEIENQAGIDAYVNTCFANMPAGLDDYGITKYIYCYVIEHTNYKKGCAHNQNICSVFLYNESVCLGYTKAVQYLLRKQGIESTIVCGTMKEQLHGWNLVKLDGQWYHLDATWGDASYSYGEGQNTSIGENEANFDCFLIRDEDIMKSHEIMKKEEYPIANSVTYDYFRKENRFFTQYDETRLEKIVKETLADGKMRVAIKASSSQVLEELVEKLFTEQKVFYLYEGGAKRVGYHTNKDVNTLTFWAYSE